MGEIDPSFATHNGFEGNENSQKNFCWTLKILITFLPSFLCVSPTSFLAKDLIKSVALHETKENTRLNMGLSMMRNQTKRGQKA